MFEEKVRTAHSNGPERIKGCVLLVDDEAALRRALADYLRMLGAEVVQAKDGHEALRQLNNLGGAVTAVISDVVMPDMGGVELVTNARAEGHSCKFILMSGHTDTRLTFDVERDPKILFMQKPFRLKDFADRLRTLISGEGVAERS